MKVLIPSILLCGAVMIGCAHGLMRGSVAMKVNDRDAHVCLGDTEVKAGDKVSLFKNECVAKGSVRTGSSGGGCNKVKLGEGVVTQTLNEHYSVVRVDPGVTFEEGTIVEKQ